jgi:HD-like signal output (HDOD) protein
VSTANRLQAMVERMGDLPTLPTVLLTINKLLTNPRTSANDVGEAITSDQVIASKVLKLVNSAFYGFPGKVNTITHAIVILGFSTVKNIVLTTSILGAFDARKTVGDFDLMAFWKHSVATGAIARLIAKEIGYRGQEEAFIAGLLHDLGKLVLALHAPEEFKACMEYASANDCLFYDAERQLLGVTHTDLGRWLQDRWNLPPDIASVLVYHHSSPSRAGEHARLVAIVQLADILARGLQIGHPCDASLPILPEESWRLLAISPQQLDSVLAKSMDEIGRASFFLQMGGG